MNQNKGHGYSLRHNPKVKSQTVVRWDEGDFTELQEYHPDELKTKERLTGAARAVNAVVVEHYTDKEMDAYLQLYTHNGSAVRRELKLMSSVSDVHHAAMGNQHYNIWGSERMAAPSPSRSHAFERC